MTLLARDIMVRDFDTVKTNTSAKVAIQMILNGKTRETGHKTISLMVLDDYGQLAGVVTMFDILYHFRPDFLNYGIDSSFMEWKGGLESTIKSLAGKKVEQIMSTHIVGAKIDDPLMVLIDRMVKNKYRRLPVLENGRPIGVVYIGDVYYHLFNGI
ncbi:MAG: CBS domain-containing protein [Desulfobacteraceae bacterium]|nr:MAG: CBS domain-containing protein [Desulfobacteraceae bacterium]